MDRQFILHMFTPGDQMSPFDNNMAVDAGCDHVFQYTRVTPEAVVPLTQDAVFSRGPKGLRRTGIFVGGRDVSVAVDMLKRARAAMPPSFEISAMADPSGAFTTAAAMVAFVERALADAGTGALSGRRVVVIGTGPVGRAAAALAAQAGAEARMCGRSIAAARDAAQQVHELFDASVQAVPREAGSPDPLRDAEVVLACAAAGVQVVSKEQLQAAGGLLAAADVNAVQPEGIAGVSAFDKARRMESGALAIGALAIGDVKYRTQQAMLQQMVQGAAPVTLGLTEAFETARRLAAKPR